MRQSGMKVFADIWSRYSLVQATDGCSKQWQAAQGQNLEPHCLLIEFSNFSSTVSCMFLVFAPSLRKLSSSCMLRAKCVSKPCSDTMLPGIVAIQVPRSMRGVLKVCLLYCMYILYGVMRSFWGPCGSFLLWPPLPWSPKVSVRRTHTLVVRAA